MPSNPFSICSGSSPSVGVAGWGTGLGAQREGQEAASSSPAGGCYIPAWAMQGAPSQGSGPPGSCCLALASVEKDFFDDSLVRRQKEEVQEAALPSPPGEHFRTTDKNKRVILLHSQDASADCGPWQAGVASPRTD